ncbi:hypothetical protein AWB67_05877 [Caballeronia terrestris]|uniref:Uncharacterized protein n=1 Tax=Caballeronia terrestris TaxID=1226301 RepID=A0A158KK70_9BURK|nr:hypothetical protein AWB67_05877 [Caballeronia terrestris]
MILCKRGKAEEALSRLREIMSKLKLTVNDANLRGSGRGVRLPGFYVWADVLSDHGAGPYGHATVEEEYPAHGLSLCTCCRHYPGAVTGGTASLIQPVISAFFERVAGWACASAFSRFAQRSLTLRPAHSRCHRFVTFVTRLPESFSHFATSMTAPVASGWSGCRAGLTTAGKRRLFTAQTHFCRSDRSLRSDRFRDPTAIRSFETERFHEASYLSTWRSRFEIDGF